MRRPLGFVLLLLFACTTNVASQEKLETPDAKAAKKHLERARQYRIWDDPRAEAEYEQAISALKNVYPVAWKELSFLLARRLRFAEATNALETAMNQAPRIRSAENLSRLDALKRASRLKSRNEKSEVLSLDELVELINLVDRFGVKGDAIPYGERIVALYPESGRALIALADLIRAEQRDRALELFNRAAKLEPASWEVYSKRGWFYRWNLGSLVEAEVDFRKAIELSNGRDSRGWQGLGDVLAMQDRRIEAIDAYKSYLRVRPASASYYDPVIKKQIKDLQMIPEPSTPSQEVHPVKRTVQ